MKSGDPRIAAVVLTGGTGERLGGVDKSALRVDAATLLEHALAATSRVAEVVVVGDATATSRQVTWTREDPPGGGPAAGLLAGVDAFAVPPVLVCVLAVDMPRFTAHTLERLTGALDSSTADAACLVDRQGRVQWLAGLYRYGALLAARPEAREAEHGLPMRRLVEPLRLVTVRAEADEARDIDTWDDLRRLEG